MILRDTNIKLAMRSKQRGFLLNPYRFNASGPNFVFPAIADNNDTFNDEGDATTGWTASNATISSSSSYVRLTKTTGTGSSASISKSWTFTPSSEDYILYGKVRCSKLASGDTGVVWILNGANVFALWLGTPDVNTSNLTATSARINNGLGDNIINLGTVSNYDTEPLEFAMHFCSKFSQVTFWFKETNGSWKFRGRAAGNFLSSTQVQVLKGGSSPLNSWIEFDYLTLCQPNIIAVGDSICAGATLFNPNRTSGLTNDESTWMRHALLYPDLRNNLIVNKGIGSETSTALLARIAEITNQSPRTVIVHASTNDETSGISLATRTTNIQNTIDAIDTAGGNTVLLNAVYGTQDNVNNPDLRDYMTDWWDINRLTLTGLSEQIDIMQPIIDSNGYMEESLTQTDNIHPTVDGYELIGEYIAS
jgi:lysophospholipase L1-like esterase